MLPSMAFEKPYPLWKNQEKTYPLPKKPEKAYSWETHVSFVLLSLSFSECPKH